MAEHTSVNQILELISKNRIQSEFGGNLVRPTSPVKEIGGGKRLVHFNISGQVFVISFDLLHKYPHCKLASLEKLEPYWAEELNAFYLDRDPALFNALLNVFKYDHIQIPKDSNETMFRKELQFWDIEPDLLLFELDENETNIEEEFLWIENKLPPPNIDASAWSKNKYKVWCFMTDPLGPHTTHRKLATATSAFFISITLLFMIIFGMSTKPMYRLEPRSNQSTNTSETNSSTVATGWVPESIQPQCDVKIECFLESRPVDWIYWALIIISCCLILETVVRIVCCPSLKKYFQSVINWCDILATVCLIAEAPLFIEELKPEHLGKALASASIALQAAQVLRLSKIFQYVNLLDGLTVMLLTLKASLYELLVLLTYILIAMFFFSTIVTFAELYITTGEGIPDALIGYWWAVITMTTVGYGDYYPESTSGHVIGVICAITGLIMTALPVAVIGSNFNVYWEHNKKRKARKNSMKEKSVSANSVVPSLNGKTVA